MLNFYGIIFYMNMNIYGDFQICISVPLNSKLCLLIDSVFVIALRKNRFNWQYVSRNRPIFLEKF